MYRKIKEKLIDWKKNDCRKPMMIIGARQVGKTYIIKEFCKESFSNYIYINLEEESEIRDIFDTTTRVDSIIKQIGFIKETSIDFESTVIVLDEIQVSEKAITSLKYFEEAEENYKIIVAGSLLGVALNREHASFPVGKVDIHEMHPMDFEEYLMALGHDDIIDEIKTCYENNQKMYEVIHNKLLEMYKEYLFVGGMPESVLSFINVDRDLTKYPRSIKKNILRGYFADMNKYTSNAEAVKVARVFESIPIQLGRDNTKFSYKLVEERGKKATHGSSIDWLLMSKIVNKATLIETPRVPLKIYHKENIFKLL